MSTTTSNTASYPELVTMCHTFYALGKQITDKANILGVSNTVLNGICSEVKGNRSTVNTYHVAILAALGAL